MSYVDKIYSKTCTDILKKGILDSSKHPTGHDSGGSPACARHLSNVLHQFRIDRDFPILTLYPQSVTYAVEELLWVFKDKSLDTSLLKNPKYHALALSDGSLGRVLGYQMGKVLQHHETFEGDDCNSMMYPSFLVDDEEYVCLDQVDAALYTLRHCHGQGQAILNLYDPADVAKMAIRPTTLQIIFRVRGDRLDCIVVQGIQNMLCDYGYNVLEYTILTKMFAQACGYNAVNLVYFMLDCYIYEKHIAVVEDILSRTPYKAPKFYLNQNVTDFYKFTRHCWQMHNYCSHPAITDLPQVVSDW